LNPLKSLDDFEKPCWVGVSSFYDRAALAAFRRTSDHCAAIPAGTIEQYQLR
jgi:hypothetical protein